jgi:hypothetical protein
MKPTWQSELKATGGYGNQSGNENASRERIWFSPHCISELNRFPLFAEATQ